MPHIASKSLKVLYCLILLSMMLPVGLAGAGLGSSTKGGLFGYLLSFAGPLILLLVAGYRIYLVAKRPGTLDSLKTSGVPAVLRRIGIAGIYAGGAIIMLSVVAIPLMKLFMKSSTGHGAEYFVVGLYLSALGGIGMLGLVAFELSRLLAFEQHWRLASQTQARQPKTAAPSGQDTSKPANSSLNHRMYKLVCIFLGLTGALLWFQPLGAYHVAFLNHTMPINGRTVSEFTKLTYGIPVSMLLFAVFAYASERQPQTLFAVIGALSTIAVYMKLGGGYTIAFLSLCAISALCVVLSIAGLAFKRGPRGHVKLKV